MTLSNLSRALEPRVNALEPRVNAPAPPQRHASATTPRQVLPTSALARGDIARVEAGPWFGRLSVGLRQSILARSRVRRAARGAVLVHRGDPAADWIGVASGALRLGSCAADGRAFTLDLLCPGEWYGDIALLDGSPADLDLTAHTASTVLMLPKADLRWLLQESDELRDALLQLHCRRLRHLFHRYEQQQTLPLAQRVALALQRLLRQFGRPLEAGRGIRIDVPMAQGDVADLLCASRQRVNGVLRQMQVQGIVSGGHSRIVVHRPEQLDALASARAQLPGLRRPAAGVAGATRATSARRQAA